MPNCEFLHVTLPSSSFSLARTRCEVCNTLLWSKGHLTTFTLNGHIIGSSLYCAEHCNVCLTEKATRPHIDLLIAAAPELYEALEDVARMFRSFPLLQKMNQEKVERIESVLAKARGEQA